MITLTDNATNRLKEFIKPETEVVRLGVEGGGCSGFQYKFGIQPIEDVLPDEHIIGEEVRLVVDPVSYHYIENVVIDFEESSFQSTFKIKNPDTTGTCGCGESFY
jgi:iron-sulfur cluster assembly accessory protein